MSDDRVDFTRSAAGRIANAVRLVEQGERDGTPLRFGKVVDTPTSKVFRVCTFTGAWAKDATKTVTLKYVTSTPNTFVARNLFAQIATSAATSRNCAIAREGTAWYLIAAECI